jgi:hypothetical protein
MEKISGILPATPRTRGADLSSSFPARAGAPTFGRKVEKIPEVADKLSLSSEFENFRAEGALPEIAPSNGYKNMEEAKKLKVIDELNKNFFLAKKDAPDVIEKSGSEVVL